MKKLPITAVILALISLTQTANAAPDYGVSNGTKAWDFGYSFPIGHHGMKFDIGYSANTTEVKKGELADNREK